MVYVYLGYNVFIKVSNIGRLNYIFMYKYNVFTPIKGNSLHVALCKKSCTGCPDSGMVTIMIYTDSYVVSWEHRSNISIQDRCVSWLQYICKS